MLELILVLGVIAFIFVFLYAKAEENTPYWKILYLGISLISIVMILISINQPISSRTINIYDGTFTLTQQIITSVDYSQGIKDTIPYYTIGIIGLIFIILVLIITAILNNSFLAMMQKKDKYNAMPEG